MKTKNKILALVEIAIVLCSVFLVAMPAIAAEQVVTQEVSAAELTTASEDDYVLGVYGNANEDDTIDMRDLTYVKLIFFGKKPETELADAKYDGKINPLDFIQIKLIIVGKEKELTLIDCANRIVTVKKPLRRIIPTLTILKTMRSLKVSKDTIVGIDKYIKKDTLFFPEFCDLPSIGGFYAPDYEVMLELNPDAVFLYGSSYYDAVHDKIESLGISVVRVGTADIESYPWEVKKLGYVLDKRDEAEEYLDFCRGCVDNIKGKTEGLLENEKPKVYYEHYLDYYTQGRAFGPHQNIVIAGGNNIFGDLSGFVAIDPEAVIECDPEIIIKHVGYGNYAFGGYSEDDTSEMKATRDAIMNRPGWGNIDAVKNGKVYIIHADLLWSPGHLIGVPYMAKWFHPDLFEDLDPKALHQEYITEFQGLAYDLDKHGVLVYHPEEHPDGK